MFLQQKLTDDMKSAMKQKDEFRLSVLRMALATIKNRVIEKKGKGGEGELTEEEVIAAMKSELKKRRDAAAEFEKGGRADLMEKEKKEAVLLQEYLPAELSDEDIEKIVKEVVGAMEDVTKNSFDPAQGREFGKVMSEAMKRIKGQASGDRVSVVVKKMLG